MGVGISNTREPTYISSAVDKNIGRGVGERIRCVRACACCMCAGYLMTGSELTLVITESLLACKIFDSVFLRHEHEAHLKQWWWI